MLSAPDRYEPAAVRALARLVPGGVISGGVLVGGRTLRWVQAGPRSGSGPKSGSGPGSGPPAVVLVAGRNNTVISWAPLLVALAGRTGVLAYDRAGLGASDPAPTPVTLEQQVADLAAVVDEVANGRCVLAGHSWGGILAQLLAFKCPGLVSGLVLIDPGHEDMVAGLPASARWLLRTTDPWLRAALRAPVLASPLARVQARRAAARLGAGPDIRSLIADAYLEAAGCPDELAGISADPPLLRAVRAAPQPFPNVPVTVLSATRGAPRRMRAHWTALQAALAAQAQQGRHVVIPAGHAIDREHPQRVAAAIRDVIAAAA